MIRAKILSFTEQGSLVGEQIAAVLSEQLTEQYARSQDLSLQHTDLSRFLQQAMMDCDLILWVGALDRAMRLIAPYVQGNGYGPAVFVVSEDGTFIARLLSRDEEKFELILEQVGKTLNAQLVR